MFQEEETSIFAYCWGSLGDNWALMVFTRVANHRARDVWWHWQQQQHQPQRQHQHQHQQQQQHINSFYCTNTSWHCALCVTFSTEIYRCVKERELVPWGRSSVWLQRGKAKMINKTFVLFLPPDCLVPFPLFSLVHCKPCPRSAYRTFSFISHQNTHRHSDNIDNGHLEHPSFLLTSLHK